MTTLREAGLRPFNESGYEILDGELLTKGELVIWSVAPLAPKVGDLFTVEKNGGLHEVEVENLTVFKGGWSARCRLYGFVAG